MAPKKKNKKKEEKSKKTKSQYLNKIAENNAILAQERKITESVEENYLSSEKKYEKEQQDLADIIKYLQHEIEENEEEIAGFNEKIDALNKEIRKNDKYYEEIFSKMENEYEEKNMELKHQVQQINAKLFASEETRQQRDEYLKKKEELEKKIEEMKMLQNKEIYEAEKLAIIKQDSMQKDLERHLTSLIVDFRQASDLAIGETVNKLVRDNIDLGNMLTCMQETIEKARNSYRKMHAKETNYKYNAELIEEKHDMAIRSHILKIQKIENLLKSQEDLHDRIRNCQKLVKGNRRLQRQIAEEECILREKNEELKHLLRTLDENEGIFNSVEKTYNFVRKSIMQLEILIFEVIKKAKEAIVVENVQHLEDEFDISKEELEENLIEFKFKTREIVFDDIYTKLSSELFDDSEAQLISHSSDSYLTSFQEISFNA